MAAVALPRFGLGPADGLEPRSIADGRCEATLEAEWQPASNALQPVAPPCPRDRPLRVAQRPMRPATVDATGLAPAPPALPPPPAAQARRLLRAEFSPMQAELCKIAIQEAADLAFATRPTAKSSSCAPSPPPCSSAGPPQVPSRPRSGRASPSGAQYTPVGPQVPPSEGIVTTIRRRRVVVVGKCRRSRSQPAARQVARLPGLPESELENEVDEEEEDEEAAPSKLPSVLQIPGVSWSESSIGSLPAAAFTVGCRGLHGVIQAVRSRLASPSGPREPRTIEDIMRLSQESIIERYLHTRQMYSTN